jgi:spore maturation protein CgeB
MEYGFPVTISGPGWEKVFSKIKQKRYMRGGMLRDAEYRENIWKSKINITFITRMNEEDVAHKAFEIAACGGFLLALRSPGHQACFEEGKEAEFFSSLEECADKIRYYLEHPVEREEIARRGCERAMNSGYDNDTQLLRVLERLSEMSTTTR